MLAVRSASAEERARALDVLVAAYWRPVFRHVRGRWREDDEDARDLAQGFFAAALEKGWLARFDPARGQFRTYLLTCLDGYVAKEKRAGRRLKRGGDATFVPLESTGEDGETRSFPSRRHRHRGRVPAGVGAEPLRPRGRGAPGPLREPRARRWPSRSSSGTTSRAPRPTTGPATRSSPRSTAFRSRRSRTTSTGRGASCALAVLDKLREITASEEEFRSEARALLGVEVP